MDSIVPVTSYRDGRNLLSIVFYTLLAIAVGRVAIRSRSSRHWRKVGFSLILLTVPFIPASNLLVHVGFVVAERILYLPSVGYCLLIGVGISRLSRHHRNGQCQTQNQRQRRRRRRKFSVVNVAAVSLFLTLAVKTIDRNGDWIDEERLYRSAIAINPPKGTYLILYSVHLMVDNRLTSSNDKKAALDRSLHVA